MRCVGQASVLAVAILCSCVGLAKVQAQPCDPGFCGDRADRFGLPYDEVPISDGAPAGCIRYQQEVLWVDDCVDRNCGTNRCQGCTVICTLDEEDPADPGLEGSGDDEEAFACDSPEACREEADILGLPFSVQTSANGAPAGCVEYLDGRIVFIETCSGHPNCNTLNCNGCEVLDMCGTNGGEAGEGGGTGSNLIIVIVIVAVAVVFFLALGYWCAKRNQNQPMARPTTPRQEQARREQEVKLSQINLPSQGQGLPNATAPSSGGPPWQPGQMGGGQSGGGGAPNGAPNVPVAPSAPPMPVQFPQQQMGQAPQMQQIGQPPPMHPMTHAAGMQQQPMRQAPGMQLPPAARPGPSTQPMPQPRAPQPPSPAARHNESRPSSWNMNQPVAPDIGGMVGKECVVCMVNNASHLFAPCGHMCVCEGCSTLVKNCPLCRSEISSAVKVFM